MVLSARLDALEGESDQYWLTLAFSLIATLISGASLLVSYRNGRISALESIKNTVNAARAQLETLGMELAPLKAYRRPTKEQRKELEIKSQVYDAALERLFNAYEDGCDHYFKNTISRRDFRDLYDADIHAYVQAFPEQFRQPDRYGRIRKYVAARQSRTGSS